NPDKNDKAVWLYVQGLKNPGLRPFQLEGPMPLRMKVPPGGSPYLKDLLGVDPKYAAACALFERGVSQRDASRQLEVALGTINKMHKRWKEGRGGGEDEGGGQDQLPY